MDPWQIGALLGVLGGVASTLYPVADAMHAAKSWPWKEPHERWPVLCALMMKISLAPIAPAALAQAMGTDGWRPVLLLGVGLAGPASIKVLAGGAVAILKSGRLKAIVNAVMTETPTPPADAGGTGQQGGSR